ncbi:MAG: glycosyltransferase family 39 protein [Actinomycetota bacterium]
MSIATICAQFTVVQGGLLNWSYDSGVYLGAAIHTLHGVLPYRDFTFVQPPGIIYMMLPPALLQWLIGGSASLGLARLMCMIIMVVNVGYVTYLLRRWGRTAQVVAGLALALWIGTIGLDWAIMMDPYLLLFTAMSIEYLIRSTESEDFASKNLRLSGIFLGIAMLMKLWAAFPMIPILLVALTWHRRKGLSLLWNATMTFFVASLPFILGAPVKFFQFNVVVQFTRSLHPISSTEINDRLNAFGNFLVYPIGHIGNAGTIFIVTLALVGFLLSIVKKSVEQAFLIVLVMGLILCLYSLVQTTLMPPYYLYFGTLFGVCLLGVTAEVLRRGISRYLKALGIGRTGLVVLIAIGLLAGTWYLQQNVAGISAYNLTELNHNASLGTLNFFKVIPNGACVQTNDPYILVYSGLIDSNVPGCPAELDPYGIWLFKAPHSVDVNGTPESALVAQEWQQFLSKSQYYVESPGLRYLLPNDSFLRAWFSHHFIEISRTDHLIIYENNSLMKTGN